MSTHRALGHRFTLGVDESPGNLLGRVLSPFALDTDAGTSAAESASSYALVARGRDREHEWCVQRDGVDVISGALAEVLASLVTAINVAAIASVPDRPVTPVVHAGAVVIDGSALVIAGEAGAGKSTLTAALVASGAAYLTDEAVPLSPDGTAQPYVKPIVVRGDSLDVLAPLRPADLAGGLGDVAFFDPHRLVGGVASSARPVRSLVCPRYRTGATLTVEPMTRGEAVAALASNVFNIRALGGDALRSLEVVTRPVRGIRIVHGDARRAAAAISDWARG